MFHNLTYRISPNKRTHPNRRPPPSIFWLVTFFLSQKLKLNPSSIADDIEPEVCYVNK